MREVGVTSKGPKTSEGGETREKRDPKVLWCIRCRTGTRGLINKSRRKRPRKRVEDLPFHKVLSQERGVEKKQM